ncbi:fumarate hydratase [Maritalea porphyrae]|jgi:fumarate hydratase class I|uniref:fumarate hydratase n=1 Tax=Maritalea porphyrae TaxID=880732 RepID=UPI0022AE59B2|nr:fumarate hydratase [Maritalea porphyrae]MCZ4271888.1 fumarate hydratase [Maritalea porphyrae]
MPAIKKEDFIQSIADGFQFISYYHPLDYVEAVAKAYEREENPAAKDAIAQILTNSRMCAEGHRPICQDTGIAVVFLEIGQDVRWDTDMTIEEMVNEGVRQAYTGVDDNLLRASILMDPAGKRNNSGDNAPAVIHYEMVAGDKVEVTVAAKGGGSENKAKLAMLNPSDDIVEWVLKTVPTLGAGWCPPGVLGIGIGGTPEKAMYMAKKSLMAPVNIQELMDRGPNSTAEELRLELFEKVNALGIGAQGLGGLTTVVDVKVLDMPTHAASKPVGLAPNCAANRHVHFTLDGTGAADLTPPPLSAWPDIGWKPSKEAKSVDLGNLSKEEVATWKQGDRLLLNGKILTGRDAAHKRIQSLYESGEGLPEGVDFTDRVIYYVGPVDPVGTEAVGPAGPTTATRMDKFTEMMLDKTGLVAMIGKAERGEAGLEAIKKHKAAYLMATGGAAYLISKAIRSSRVVAFEELGMEAIYEFEVENMPVTVAVDATGESVHNIAPAIWRKKIGKLPEPA